MRYSLAIVIILVAITSWWLLTDSKIEEYIAENQVAAKASTIVEVSDRELSQMHFDPPEDKVKKHLIKTTKPVLNVEINLDSTESRQNYYNETLNHDSRYIWNSWSELLHSDQVRKRDLAGDALAWKLQHDKLTNNDIYLELNDLLSAGEFDQQMTIINLLGRISTKDSMQILVDELLTSSNSDIQHAIFSAINTSVSNLWDGIYHTELSEPLEDAWNMDITDGQILSNISSGIAKVGSPDGIQLLLDTFKQYSMDELADSGDVRARTAFSAMREIRNTESIPILMDSINNNDINSASYNAKIDSLASFGNADATEVLLFWAKNTSPGSVELVKKAFMQLHDSQSISRVNYVLQSDEIFLSDEIKGVISEAMSQTTLMPEIELEVPEATTSVVNDSNSEDISK